MARSQTADLLSGGVTPEVGMAKGKEMDSPKTLFRGGKEIFHIFNPFQAIKLFWILTHSDRLETATVNEDEIGFRAIITSRQIITHTAPFHCTPFFGKQSRTTQFSIFRNERYFPCNT